MTNGRRRPAPGGARRGGSGQKRPAGGRRREPARRQPAGRRPGPGRGGYDDPAAGVGGLHPGLVIGMVGVILVLVVVVVIAAMGGDDKPKVNQNDIYVPVVENPEPTTAPVQPKVDAPKVTRPPTKAEMDMLERSWAPLRKKAQRMRQLRDEGIEFWHKQDKVNMQKKYHAAKREWHAIRDTGWKLLGRFTEEQVDEYLSRYEIDLIQWGKAFNAIAKDLDISE